MKHSSDFISKLVIGVGITFAVVVIIWFALICAPYLSGGLPLLVRELPQAMEHPLDIVIDMQGLKTALAFLLLSALVIVCVASGNDRQYRHGREHGSAKWGNSEQINAKYTNKEVAGFNKILSRHISIGYDDKRHNRNLNTIVVGGSGSGKSAMFVKTNLLNADGNCSFFVLDPKGENLRDTAAYLEQTGYRIQVLDLIHMEKSDCYNPFVYLHDENDVQKLVTNLFKATTPQGSKSSDPFWDGSASMLLSACIYYLLEAGADSDRNFATVMDMLRCIQVNEDDPSEESLIDVLFDELSERQPEHIAVKYYKSFKSGAGKTLKSIVITLIQHLEKFNLDSLSQLTSINELDLCGIGEQKTALFAIIPDSDTSFNFLVSILYTQLFQQLFELADSKYHGALPLPVHILMDEFANLALPDDFEKILATMRSRKISVSIILQNIAQLKALFEKSWESILGNCDGFLYLGGNEASTHEYISKYLGKETIHLDSFGKSRGRNGSYSVNTQTTGRELMTPDEVRMLDNQYLLLFIRGEKPVKDLKYKYWEHPNAKYSPTGGGKPYIHGQISNSVGKLEVIDQMAVNIRSIETINLETDTTLQLFTKEEAEKEFLENGEQT